MTPRRIKKSISTTASHAAAHKKEDGDSSDHKSANIDKTATPKARVYKRWIIFTAMITLVLSYILFSYWIFPQSSNDVENSSKGPSFHQIIFQGTLSKFIPENFFSEPQFLKNISKIIEPYWQTSLEETGNPGSVLAQKGAKAKYPIMIIPGITSTGLELWKGKPCAQSFFRQRLWGTLTMMRFMIMDSKCWLEHLKLDMNTGSDPEGIKLRAAQGLEACDYLLPGFWIWARIIENLAEVGYDHNNLQLAAYDWRLDVEMMEERDHYFTRLKSSIEALWASNGEKKVIITSHSLGGLIWFYFMKWVEVKAGEGWVEKHIHSSISIGAPYLGVPKSMSTLISAETRDTAQLGMLESYILEFLASKQERLSIFRTWGGGFAMMPKGAQWIWGDSSPGSIVDACEECNFGLINIETNLSVDNKDGGDGEKGDKKENSSTLRASVSTTRPEFNDQKELVRSYLAQDTYYTQDVQEVLDKFVPEPLLKRVRAVYSNAGIATPENVRENDKIPSTWTNPLEASLPNAPSLIMYSLYGVGKDTERGYQYKFTEPDQWPSHLQTIDEASRHHELDELLLMMSLDLDALDTKQKLYRGIYHVDGDGTVPTLSNGYMSAHAWKQFPHLNPSGLKSITREYEHKPSKGINNLRGGPTTADHVDILGNYELTMDILKIATDFREYADVAGEIAEDDNNFCSANSVHNGNKLDGNDRTEDTLDKNPDRNLTCRKIPYSSSSGGDNPVPPPLPDKIKSKIKEIQKRFYSRRGAKTGESASIIAIKEVDIDKMVELFKGYVSGERDKRPEIKTTTSIIFPTTTIKQRHPKWTSALQRSGDRDDPIATTTWTNQTANKLLSFLQAIFHRNSSKTHEGSAHNLSPVSGKIKIIGLHGWVPTMLLQSLVGIPKGTSMKLTAMMKEAIIEYRNSSQFDTFLGKGKSSSDEKARMDNEDIECIALERAGCIEERVDAYYKHLTEEGSKFSLSQAHSVIFVAHSQGAPVASLLIARLLENKQICAQSQSISFFSLAGVFHGPVSALRDNLVVKYVEADAARELFSLVDAESRLCRAVDGSLVYCLESGVYVGCVAGWLDSVVPLYSSLMLAIDHPNIWRSIYVDVSGKDLVVGGSNPLESDFLLSFVDIVLGAVNAGLDGSRDLLVMLSEHLKGSLYGSNSHSSLYDDKHMFKCLLETCMHSHNHQLLTHHTKAIIDKKIYSNDTYMLPWILRGLVDDASMGLELREKFGGLSGSLNSWMPKGKSLITLKRQLSPLSKL